MNKIQEAQTNLWAMIKVSEEKIATCLEMIQLLELRAHFPSIFKSSRYGWKLEIMPGMPISTAELVVTVDGRTSTVPVTKLSREGFVAFIADRPDKTRLLRIYDEWAREH